MAPETLQDAYRCLVDDLSDYVEEVQKQAFCYGYEIGMKDGEKNAKVKQRTSDRDKKNETCETGELS